MNESTAGMCSSSTIRNSVLNRFGKRFDAAGEYCCPGSDSGAGEQGRGVDIKRFCAFPDTVFSVAPGESVICISCSGPLEERGLALQLGPTGKLVSVRPEVSESCEPESRNGCAPVEVVGGSIESIPRAAGSADVVIVHCCMSVAKEKESAWQEVFRVLKPCGRLYLSDLAFLRPLPEDVCEEVRLLLGGCINHAATVDDMIRRARKVGLRKVRMAVNNAFVDHLYGINDRLYRDVLARLPASRRLSDFVSGVTFTAVKPQ